MGFVPLGRVASDLGRGLGSHKGDSLPSSKSRGKTVNRTCIDYKILFWSSTVSSKKMQTCCHVAIIEVAGECEMERDQKSCTYCCTIVPT